MKQLKTRAALGALIAVTAAGLAFLCLGLGTPLERSARAEPAVTIGIDVDPYATPANTATSLGSRQACIRVSNGAQFDVDMYITDVTDLLGWSIILHFHSTVLTVIGETVFVDNDNDCVGDWNPVTRLCSTSGGIDEDPIDGVDNDGDTRTDEDPVDSFLSAGSGSNVIDMSGSVPDITENYPAGALDIGSNNDSGSGVLVRLRLQAADTGTGSSPLNPTWVNLWDSEGDFIGDTNGDGYFDGPIRNGMIAVGEPCPDADQDTIPDAADNCPLIPNPGQEDGDSDGKGDVCDNCPLVYNYDQADTDNDGIGNVCDNCATVANHDQTNTDAGDQDGDTRLNEDPFDGIDNDHDGKIDEDPPGDAMGDACDADDDADGFLDTTEVYYNSNPLDLTSLVEVCDDGQVDEDGDTFVNEGYDYNSNGVPDCTEAGLDTDGDGLFNPADPNDDDDGNPDPGFNEGVDDVKEHWMGTDSLDACPDTREDNAWPHDNNNDTKVNIGDVLRYSPYLLTKLGDANYNRRFDLDANKKVNVGDVLKMVPYILTQCTQ
jgi:hypothetical protein